MRFPCLTLFITVIGVATLRAQDTKHNVDSLLRHSGELRAGIGPRELTLTAEYRFKVIRYVSVDASVWIAPFSAHLGASVWPSEWFGLQASAGVSSYDESVIDGPTFASEYSYAVTGTLRLPLPSASTPRLFLAIVGGPVWYVDRDFVYNAGFIVDPNWTPQYRVETRMIGRLEFGIGMMF